jgi:uncharacterized protein (DUF302 family)
MKLLRSPVGLQAAFTLVALLTVAACTPVAGTPPATPATATTAPETAIRDAALRREPRMKGESMNTSIVDSFVVEHREYPAGQSFEQVVAAFERLVPPIDSAALAVEVARASGADELEAYFRAQAGPSGFMRFAVFDHGDWLAKFGRSARIRSYILGNPLVARTMIVHDSGVGLNVPVRVLIYEGRDGRTRIAYDVPSTLMGRLNNPEVTKAAVLLDGKLRALAEQVTHAPGG